MIVVVLRYFKDLRKLNKPQSLNQRQTILTKTSTVKKHDIRVHPKSCLEAIRSGAKHI